MSDQKEHSWDSSRPHELQKCPIGVNDMTGMQFGSFTVMGYLGPYRLSDFVRQVKYRDRGLHVPSSKGARWLLRCNCGAFVRSLTNDFASKRGLERFKCFICSDAKKDWERQKEEARQPTSSGDLGKTVDRLDSLIPVDRVAYRVLFNDPP